MCRKGDLQNHVTKEFTVGSGKSCSSSSNELTKGLISFDLTVLCCLAFPLAPQLPHHKNRSRFSSVHHGPIVLYFISSTLLTKGREKIYPGSPCRKERKPTSPFQEFWQTFSRMSLALVGHVPTPKNTSVCSLRMTFINRKDYFWLL